MSSCSNTRRLFNSLGRQDSRISELRDHDELLARWESQLSEAANTFHLNLPRCVAREAGTLLGARQSRANAAPVSLVQRATLKQLLTDLRIGFGLQANVKDEPRPARARLVREDDLDSAASIRLQVR